MGNGIQFDITDDEQFRNYCVQQFTLLGERTQGLVELKAEHAVMKQEIEDLRDDMKDATKWENIKMACGPVMVVIHGICHKFGIL